MNSLETRLAPFLDQVPPGREDEARRAFASLKMALHQGTIRAAERDADGTWRVNGWVKRGILLGFRLGVLVDAGTAGPMRFFDKDSFGVRATTIDEGIRIVPGGTAVREGSYLARGVIVIPPAYVQRRRVCR